MPSRRRSLLYIAGGTLCLSAGVVSGYVVQTPTKISALESRDSITSVGLLDENDSSSSSAAAPLISPATRLPNRIYSWRQQDIRYQVAGDVSSPNAVVLVHGLFVNSDHWRKQIQELAATGYRVYALDLLGSGYSSKPSPWDASVNELVNGENGRFYDDEVSIQQGADKKRVIRSPSVVEDVQLGTSRGGTRRASVDLRHPLGSFYNFYTWSEQVCDFTRDIVLASNTGAEKATLVGNSKGTLVSLQAAMDSPDLYNGAFLINPTFREQHSAETPKFMMPLTNAVQRWLRNHGHGLFDKVAKPDIIKKILKEPYAVTSAVDDQLVEALLTPLLSSGAKDVVFDMLSYTGGPLIEQQLQDVAFPKSIPISIAYGTADPWLPVARTNALSKLPTVDKVIPLPGLGHCPHDESEAMVNPLLVEFIEHINNGEAQAEKEQDSAASPARVERPQRRIKIWNQTLSPAFIR